MPYKIFSKPMILTVGERTFSFLSIADFEFCLSGRTSVPSAKIKYLVRCSAKKLKMEARTIKDIEKRFIAILSRSIEEPSSISRSFKELDTSIFSKDHEWRNIIVALNTDNDEFNPFRKIALVKYLQYLSSRQEIIRYLYSEKKKSPDEKLEEDEKFKDTLIFEEPLSKLIGGDQEADALARMPKGESVVVTLNPSEHITVMLSKHKCRIEANGKIFFIDQVGQKYALDMGRNVIGRAISGNIIIDNSLRDVSKIHFLIENLGQNLLQLTDLSSHGTYVPSAFLEDRTS